MPMSQRFRQLALLWGPTITALVLCTARAEGAKPEREREFREKVAPLLKKYCIDCHGDDTTEGDLSLQSVKSAQAILEGRKTWFKVINKLAGGEMPPKDAKLHPTKEER